MKTLVRLFISFMVVLLLGSMPENSAHARRSGHSHGSRVGVGIWLGPGWWGPYHYPSFYYPYYPYYPYYRTEPPLVIQQRPEEEYVQPDPEAEEQQIFWYYCKDPQGYYPYVKECPSGWMKVVPSPPPSSSPPDKGVNQP